MGSEISRHLDELRRANKRPGTIAQRRRHLTRTQKFLNATPLLAATTDQLTEWIFDARDLTPGAQASEISHHRAFYGWAVRSELLDVDPTAKLTRPRIPKRLPKPMNEADLAVAIEMAPPARIRPFLLLAAYAGLRCHEIAQLSMGDFWWDHDPALIMVVDSKGGDSTSAQLSPHLAAELKACDLPTSGWAFPYRNGRRGHVPAHYVSQLGNRYLHSLGIVETMHSLRHRFGTELLKVAGGNVRTAQEGLRHASIVSTQLYTFVAPTDLAAAVAKLPVASTHPQLPFGTVVGHRAGGQ